MAFSASNVLESNLGSTERAKLNLAGGDWLFVTPSNTDYTIRQYIPRATRFDNIYFKTASGTCTLAVKLDGTNITGWSALNVTSTEGTAAASGANTAAAGVTLSVTVSANSNADRLSITIVGETT